MDRLAFLADRLAKISEARRLNAVLKTRLMQRLSVIDAQLFALTNPSSQYPYAVIYDHREMKGISESEHRKLVHMFWGRTLVGTPGQRESRDRRSPSVLSPLSRRSNFLNSARSLRQRCLVSRRDTEKLRFFKHESLCQVDACFCVIEAVRFYVMTSVFGDSVSMRKIYPLMDLSRMRLRFRDIEKSGRVNSLKECGINVEEMQQRISTVLRHNSRLALAPRTATRSDSDD
jgi:hypothetical protein